MGHYVKKESVLCFSALLLLFLLAVSMPNAAAAGTCCISMYGNCQSEVTEAWICEGDGGTFDSTHSCGEINECITDTCCIMSEVSCGKMPTSECIAQEGTPSALVDDECICTQVSDKITLSGIVNYSNNVYAANAYIAIFNDTAGTGADVLIANIRAGANGAFSINVKKNTDYYIRVTLTSSTSSICNITSGIIHVAGADVNAGTLKLPCPSPLSGCLTDWEEGEWDQRDHTCGHRNVTPGGNCAVITYHNKPAEYLACTDAVCGNGDLDPGEECDMEDGEPVFRADRETCADIFDDNSAGSLACSDQCQTITAGCVTCEGACNSDKMCDLCQDLCEDDPFCIDTCSSSDEIASFEAAGTYENGVKGFVLDWQLPEQCLSSIIKIYRCRANADASGCGGNSIPIKTLPGTETTYKDFDILPSINSYCYNISVQGIAGFEEFAISAPELVCVSVWDDECVDSPDDFFCDADENLLSCQGGHLTNTDDCACGCRDKTALAPASCAIDNGEQCGICDACSGLFGLYAYMDFELSEIEAYSGIYSSCEDDLLSSFADEKFCYRDDFSNNDAVIGQYKVCSNVSGCYDYKTKISCESNPCSIQKVEDGDCSWHSMFSNDELGIGVCVPNNPEEHECSKCGENGALGNYCDPVMCSLYGQTEDGESTCYYNYDKKYDLRRLAIDNTSCINAEDVVCETYDSMTECLGVAAGCSGTGGKNFTVNISDRNQHSSESCDPFNRKKCAWIIDEGEGRCIRDADMTRTSDPESDCQNTASSNKNLNCFKDYTDPVTQLFVVDSPMQNFTEYSIAELNMLSVNTSELVDETLLSISDDGQYVKPEINYVQRAQLIDELEILHVQSPQSIMIYFYSKDEAGNMEHVQTHNITLIPELSEDNVMNVSYNVSSTYDALLDIFTSELTVMANHSNEMTCRMSLINLNDLTLEYAGDGLKTGSNQIIWTYESLSDGSYNIQWNCIDQHLQSINGEMDVAIDADRTIHDAFPRGETFNNGSIQIGLSTMAEAECYYVTNRNPETGIDRDEPAEENVNPLYPWRKLAADEDGLNHDATINESVGGLKYYYTACYFPGEDIWTTLAQGDVIYFAIDTWAPNITVINSDGDDVYNFRNSTVVEELTLKIECDDSTADLKITSGSKTTSYEFGCYDTMGIAKYYVDYQANNVNVTTLEDSIRRESGDSIEINSPDTYYGIYLNITAGDDGKKNNRTIIQWVNVRNLSFFEPLIEVCNPDLEEEICQ